MVTAVPQGGGDRPDELLGGDARLRTAPEGAIAQVGGQVVGRAEPADLGRRHRPEHETPQELGPLALAVTGDLDLGVAVHRGQAHAHGVGHAHSSWTISTVTAGEQSAAMAASVRNSRIWWIDRR